MTGPEEQGAAVPGGTARLKVPAALHGERLDRGLALLTGLPRSRVARLVAEGRARVGGRPAASASRRLSQGELLEVDLGEQVGMGEAGGPQADHPVGGVPPAARWQGPPAAVVYADDDVLVVDKPAGLVVHPGAGNRAGTLVDELLREFPDLAGAGPDGDRPGIVHRIDKGTSGLLMVARTSASRLALASQLATRTVDRRYLAVVHGLVEADEGMVDAPLGRSPRQRVKVAVVEGGRSARTRYRCLGRSLAPLQASLLSCRLETGRTHQIRAHMAAIGHPVVADERYAKPSLVAEARRALPGLHRPWLHAAHLGFTHPTDGRRLEFDSALPGDLLAALALLGLEVPGET